MDTTPEIHQEATFMTIDEKSFAVDFKEHVNWCRFQVYHQLLRKEFLPNTPFDAGAIVRAIHECKQTYWDQRLVK
jgi:tRNA splicing endonuclease